MSETLTVPQECASAAVSVEAQIDRLEAMLRESDCVKLDLPLHHMFTPGLYIREILLPKGSLTVSKIHNTTHPFFISRGRVAVFTEGGEVVHLAAPHTGITTPGTRRVIYAYEDTIWSTCHPTEETDVKKIEDAIIQKHEIPAAILEEAIAALRTYRHAHPELQDQETS